MSPSNRNEESRRPTLPPIRDLFRDELLQKSYEPPQVTLARLRVSDSDQAYRVESPRFAQSTSSRQLYQPHEASSHRSQPGHASRPAYDTSMPPPNGEHSSLQRSYSHHGGDNRSHHPQHQHPVTHMRQPYDRETGERTDSHRPDSRGDNTNPEPRYTLSPAYPPPLASASKPRVNSMGDPRHYPWPISTRVDRAPEDNDRTPTARYAHDGHPVPPYYPQRQPSRQEPPPPPPTTSKYECPYCRKGFNRPSSLKIHLNSHTGEKPFECPVEGCGRSFSVLSNMRRHARVHIPNNGKEASSDDSARHSAHSSSSMSLHQTDYPRDGFADPRWLERRGSISSSSTSSRRSRSVSSDDEDDEERPEKRTRQGPTFPRR